MNVQVMTDDETRGEHMKVSHCCFRLTGLVLVVAAGAGAAFDAGAQAAYPSKTIQMIVPYTPSGSIDLLSRAVAQRLGEAWGRNIVVDNRPGASGMIGTEIVTKAEPDGHTLLGHTSSYPATAAVRAKLPFDPGRAIVPVAMFAKAPMLLAVHPSVPAKSVKELVELGRKSPGKLNYGSSGAGGNNHFSGSLFAAAAGIKLVHVPYKGISMATTALASGEVEIVIAVLQRSPQVKAAACALGATSLQPSPLPGLPAIAVRRSGCRYAGGACCSAAAGRSAQRDHAAVNKILASDDMKKFLANEV
jgi:tripartite-type tricarboxylate transporter receptor subunit TctC